MPEQPSHAGHRQRLKDKFKERGADALADYELIELMLMMAIPRRDVKPLAKKLLTHFKTVPALFAADWEELSQVDGVGNHAALMIKLTSALKLRSRRQALTEKPAFDNRLDLLDYLYTLMSDLKHEEFRVIYLNSKNHMVDEQVLFKGTVNASAVYPREVIKTALDKAATSLVLVHNHPSGDPSPSASDDHLTKELAKIGAPLHIEIHDHIIIGDGVHYSYRDHGKL